MSIQFPRGNTAANNSHTGAEGSVTIDFEGERVVVHDGVTEGGAFSVGVSEGGAGETNLSVNYATDSFTVTSSTGSNATVNAATESQAGAMSSSDKTKLNGIDSGAQQNVGTDLSNTRASNSVTVISSTGDNTTLNSASTTEAGVLSANDKSKLDGIQEGAEANVGDTFDSGGDYSNLRARATTSADVGLGSVQNYGIASTAQAEDASSNSVYMTPLRVAELLGAGNFSIDFGTL